MGLSFVRFLSFSFLDEDLGFFLLLGMSVAFGVERIDEVYIYRGVLYVQ